MGIYSKTSVQMLVDLLNASNPSLPIPVTTSLVKFGTVTSVTPGSGQIQDTQVKVIATPGSQYGGNQTLTYRRLNATVLFRSVPLRIDLYSAASAGTSPYKMSQLLPYINAKYGLNLQASDITDVNFPAWNTNANAAYGVPAGTANSVATLTFVSGNYAWLGNINVCWVQAPQDLSTLIATPSLETALTYPGQRDVVDNTVYVPNLDSYYLDFTDPLTAAFTSLANIPAFTASTIASSPAAGTASIISVLAAATGKAYAAGGDGSAAFSLTNALLSTNIDLTTAANQALYPEADFRYFNRMILIKLQAANTWGAGDIMMHYNV